MFKGIVFDMDGLMFDTENLAVDSWVFAWSQIGVEITAELVKTTIGMNLEDTCQVFARHLHRHIDIQTVQKLRFDYAQAYIEKNGVPVKPGLLELLDHLKENDYRIGVATSTAAEKVNDYFLRTGLTPYFQAIVCGDMIARCKPEPDIYIKACELLKLKPADCIALEDSPIGIRAAYAAGLKVVMVPDLVQPDHQIKPLLYAEVPTLHHVIGLVSHGK